MKYNITDYSYDRAKQLNVKIQPSDKSNYKIDVFDKNDDYITSIGDKHYSDFPTYIQTHGILYAIERRKLYHLRHKKDNGVKGFYALKILW